MINLYRLSKMYREVELALMHTDGEITPELETMLKELSGEKDDKLIALASLIKNTEGEASIYRQEEKRLEGIRRACERRLEKLTELVKLVLPEGESWSKDAHSLTYRESKAVEVVDFDAVPEDYKRTKTSVEVDKAKAAAFFKTSVEAAMGDSIPGLDFVTRQNLQVK